jgi:hypothetical protein
MIARFDGSLMIADFYPPGAGKTPWNGEEK